MRKKISFILIWFILVCSVIPPNYTPTTSISIAQPAPTIPVIVDQSADIAVKVGDDVSLHVSALGQSITYQWWKQSDLFVSFEVINNGADDTEIVGAVSATLVIDNAQESHSGRYYCKVVNAYASIYSETILLTVTPSAVTPTPTPASTPTVTPTPVPTVEPTVTPPAVPTAIPTLYPPPIPPPNSETSGGGGTTIPPPNSETSGGGGTTIPPPNSETGGGGGGGGTIPPPSSETNTIPPPIFTTVIGGGSGGGGTGGGGTGGGGTGGGGGTDIPPSIPGGYPDETIYIPPITGESSYYPFPPGTPESVYGPSGDPESDYAPGAGDTGGGAGNTGGGGNESTFNSSFRRSSNPGGMSSQSTPSGTNLAAAPPPGIFDNPAPNSSSFNRLFSPFKEGGMEGQRKGGGNMTTLPPNILLPRLPETLYNPRF